MGRAIIYARKGDSSRANAELEQAKKLDADIEQRFSDYGLKL
jgi:Flp pilus assembly protein TadD